MNIVKIAALAALQFVVAGAAFAGDVVGPPTVDVPEPTTLALLAAGVGAIAIAKFRRR